MAAPTIDNIVEELLPDFGVNALKPEQKEIISNNITKKNDCIAVLPTGFGKSLPFQVYAAAQKRISREAGHVLVCSPLIGLMKDQTKKLSHISYLSVGYKGESASMDEKIKRGDIDLMYASPEALVGDPEWRTAFQKLNVTLIVVDEFHTIYTWGLQSDNRKEAFRGWFAQLGELGSFYPYAPLLALSATCSLKIRKKAMKVLNLNDPAEITLSPNKSNIKLIVKKVSNSVEMALLWLIDGLNTLKEEFPKCLVYCSSIKDASIIYKYILTECPDLIHYVEMFHSESAEKTKDRIISALGNPNSELRIIIATNALGMGVDIQGFHSLVLCGPPQTTVDLIQGIGRLGRDGSPSCAILLHNSFNVRNTDLDVKSVIRDASCRRLSLIKSFLKDSELNNIHEEMEKHTCCDICEEKCNCGDCLLLPIEKLLQMESENEDDELEPNSESDATDLESSNDLEDL